MTDKSTIQRYRTEGVRLAFILRHKPENYGLSIDTHGWVSVKDLLEACEYTPEFLDELVTADNKGRYVYNEDKSKIRACQGHTHPKVQIEHVEVTPPNLLYHGTTMTAFAKICFEGLDKMERHDVHIHDSEIQAIRSAMRWKSQEPFLIRIDAKQMVQDGFKFYRSSNGVWLTKHVPSKYLFGYWPSFA